VQQVERAGWESHRSPFQGNGMSRGVNRKVPDPDLNRLLDSRELCLSQPGLNPGHQDIHVEGLGDVVNRPELEAQHLIQGTPSRGEEDDRRADLGAKSRQSIQTIDAGKADVKQDQVGMVSSGQRQGVLGVRTAAYPIACLLQIEGQAASEQRIVIDNEEMSRHVATIPPAEEPRLCWVANMQV